MVISVIFEYVLDVPCPGSFLHPYNFYIFLVYSDQKKMNQIRFFKKVCILTQDELGQNMKIEKTCKFMVEQRGKWQKTTKNDEISQKLVLDHFYNLGQDQGHPGQKKDLGHNLDQEK